MGAFRTGSIHWQGELAQGLRAPPVILGLLLGGQAFVATVGNAPLPRLMLLDPGLDA